MIVVKAIFESSGVKEVKRLPMSRLPGELSYDELCLIVHRLFRTLLSSNENLILRYVDDEGDLCVLESDVDISHAFTLNSTLKIHVFDKVTNPLPSDLGKEKTEPESIDIPNVIKTLTALKKTCEACLESLQKHSKKQNEEQKSGQLSKNEITTFLQPSTVPPSAVTQNEPMKSQNVMMATSQPPSNPPQYIPSQNTGQQPGLPQTPYTYSVPPAAYSTIPPPVTQPHHGYSQTQNPSQPHPGYTQPHQNPYPYYPYPQAQMKPP